MRALVRTPDDLEVRQLPDPEPGPGQVLVRTLACGVCGSDLHAFAHPAEMSELMRVSGAPGPMDPGRDLVFGHEFVAEVVAYGPETRGTLPPGTRVCSVPYAFGPEGPELIGFSHRFAGGFAELMVLQETTLLPVPDGLDPQLAALTEPLAVGEHAVAVADPQPDWPCLVVGAGPIGLAILLALKARRTGPIVVADLAPARRALALELGADAVVDPRETPGYVDFAAFGVPTDPLARQAALAVGEDPRRAVLFEAVGVPGVIQGLVAAAPPASRIVVAGVCMETDRFEPGHAVGKELELRFAFGYTGAEFSATLERIAADPAPGAALISDRVALLDLARTFRSLADGDPEQVKVLVVHEA